MIATPFKRIPILFLLIASGCGRAPTDDERDNRRALDAVLTAITLKNQRLLRESSAVVKIRHDQGKFTDDEFQGIDAFVAKARKGDWSAAESDAYQFRKVHPFVKPGQ